MGDNVLASLAIGDAKVELREHADDRFTVSVGGDYLGDFTSHAEALDDFVRQARSCLNLLEAMFRFATVGRG